MQIDEDGFEERLKRLKPWAPSSALKERLALEMAELEREGGETLEFSAGGDVSDSSKGKVLWRTTFTALVSAMAAVWAVVLVLDYQAEPPRIAGEQGEVAGSNGALESGATFKVDARPLEQYATLVSAEPSPVYYLEDGSPVQNVSFRYVDTEVWLLPDSEETFTVSSLRDEIRVVPMQSF